MSEVWVKVFLNLRSLIFRWSYSDPAHHTKEFPYLNTLVFISGYLFHTHYTFLIVSFGYEQLPFSIRVNRHLIYVCAEQIRLFVEILLQIEIC